MGYNSYFANVVTRLFLLLATFIGLAYLVVNTERFFSILFLVLLAILQTIALINFLNRTNRNLARFLLLLTEEDTSVILWKEKVEKTFKGLHHSFKKVNEEIVRMRMEKEKGSILLRNLINHINSGILAVEESGRVIEANAAALKIFGLVKIENLNELDGKQDGLSSALESMNYESGNILEYSPNKVEKVSLLVKVSLLKLEALTLRLYSIQGIGSQLEANEIESWQKMSRVLSHEISNSVTPISTLGAGIHRKLSKARYDEQGNMVISAAVAKDLFQSAGLLEQRCDAMVEFMEHYKNFARLPEPVIERIEVNKLLQNVALYFKDELEALPISLTLDLSTQSLIIKGDPNLLHQALINLIRNSMAAVTEKGRGHIELKSGTHPEGGIMLEVSDDGPGIPPDIQSQVFIPFFTTRSNGTGIGLSIVKKIVFMLGGNVYFQTGKDLGTTFFIHLPDGG